jgi:hypothetical protein
MSIRSRAIRSPGTRFHDWFRVSLVLLAPALIVVSAGCGSGDGLNRKAVSGKVTVDGAPVPNGSVSFQPLNSGGVGSGAPIADGAYSIDAEHGLPPGKYRVSITGDDGTMFNVSEGKMPGDEEMPEIKQLVPADWNKGGEHDIEVKEDGPFEFNFDIKSKA